MGEVINFPRLKIGELIKIEVLGEIFTCKVLEHLGDENYKIKALNGKYVGQVSNLQMTAWVGEDE